MNIANFNKKPSRIDFFNDAACMYPNTILADTLLLASGVSIEIIVYVAFDKWDDEFIINQILYNYRKYEGYVASVEKIKTTLPDTLKLIRSRAKDKLALEIIGRHKSAMILLRKQLKICYTDSLTRYKLLELCKFAHDESWTLAFPLGNEKANMENDYIPVLTQTIMGNECQLAFDSVVEQLFEYVDINIASDAPYEFVKIPLWDFPLLDGMKFNQVKYTQQDLKPSLQEFTKHFDELSAQLFTLPFTSENQAEIIALAKEKIGAQVSPVQQAIDNSLYISQTRNQTPPNTGMKFHLGITSAENLVNYYEKTEMIEAYVASEIKEQLRRYINLQATCFFTYITIQKPSYNVQ